MMKTRILSWSTSGSAHPCLFMLNLLLLSVLDPEEGENYFKTLWQVWHKCCQKQRTLQNVWPKFWTPRFGSYSAKPSQKHPGPSLPSAKLDHLFWLIPSSEKEKQTYSVCRSAMGIYDQCRCFRIFTFFPQQDFLFWERIAFFHVYNNECATATEHMARDTRWQTEVTTESTWHPLPVMPWPATCGKLQWWPITTSTVFVFDFFSWF